MWIQHSDTIYIKFFVDGRVYIKEITTQQVHSGYVDVVVVLMFYYWSLRSFFPWFFQ